MAVRPSCPILLIHDDDEFRKALIAALDRRNFTVTYMADGEEAFRALQERSFEVVLLGVDLGSGKGLKALDYLRDQNGTNVIVVGEPDPNLRNYVRGADETLLKPVDPDYVATRAATYCT
jgi:DNA-binding response OmpR family regulator